MCVLFMEIQEKWYENMKEKQFLREKFLKEQSMKHWWPLMVFGQFIGVWVI